MTGVGRQSPIRKAASAIFSVTGNGNSVPNSDEGTDSKLDYSNWRETTLVSHLRSSALNDSEAGSCAG